MAKQKKEKQAENPEVKAGPAKTEKVTKKVDSYKFLKEYRLVINGDVREYKKDDIITGELFRANYPDKSGELFLKGLNDAGVLG